MSDSHSTPLAELDHKTKFEVAFKWLQVLACIIVMLGFAWGIFLGPLFSMAMQNPFAIFAVIIAVAIAVSLVIIAIAYAESIRRK